jgi:hypothetical protein
MDYKELALTVAEKLGGSVRDEVEAELRLGPSRGGRQVGIALAIIALAQLVSSTVLQIQANKIQIEASKSNEQYVDALKAMADELAHIIDQDKRKKNK